MHDFAPDFSIVAELPEADPHRKTERLAMLGVPAGDQCRDDGAVNRVASPWS